MKTHPLVFLAIVASAAIVRSQDAPSAPIPTAARIIGPIPDGTPPPAATPKPEYYVASRDILSTETHQQAGRTITVREIKPIALPQPPSPAEITPTEADREFIKQLKAYYAANPRPELLCLGATVFRSANQPPRTLVRYWLMEEGREITFWSSADFSLIAGGISSFTDTNGTSHSLFMSWSSVDVDRATKLQATRDRLYQTPEIPAFPEGKATFQIIGQQPAAETLTAIQSLHDLYNSELPRLQSAYQGREQARLQQEAYQKANPPQPKDITLNYWRTEKPANTKKGGAQ